MYSRKGTYAFKESCSSLYENLDWIPLKEDTEHDGSWSQFVSVHKTNINIVQCSAEGKLKTSQVLNKSSSPINECPVIQVKWCKLQDQDVLVVVNNKGLLIYDAPGQLLVYWHSPKESEDNENMSPYCRGIACVAEKYICVGSASGVIVLAYTKNTFSVSETLSAHSQPITALSGVKASNSQVDFVSADDVGTICCYKSGNKFLLVSQISGNSDVCTSISLLNVGLVIAGYLSGHLRIYNAPSGVILSEIAAHVRAVSCLDYSHCIDGAFTVVSGSEDSFIRVWKVSTNNTIEVSHEWCTTITDSQVCGVKLTAENGTNLAVTTYDSKDIVIFAKT